MQIHIHRSNTFTSFEEIQDEILHVALVRPKAGAKQEKLLANEE